MREKHKSCLTLSELCGVCRNQMGDITSGKKKDIKLSTIARICENTDIKPEQVFGEFKPEDILNGAIITISGDRYKLRLEKQKFQT